VLAAPDLLLLGNDGERDHAATGNFRGSLDELYVADRALTPAEIQRLMSENRIADRVELAAD
jgi:hypothetical protein